MSSVSTSYQNISVYNHIVLIGNYFNFFEDSSHVDVSEQTEMLMVPTLKNWIPQFVLIVIFCCFVSYSRRNVDFFPEYLSNDFFFKNHSIILNYSYIFFPFLFCVFLYFLNSNWFECGYFFDHLTISDYVHSSSDNILILSHILYICCCFVYVTRISIVLNPPDNNQTTESFNTNKKIYLYVGSILLIMVVLLFVSVMVFLGTVSHYVPPDSNTIGFNSVFISIISHTIPLIISITNSFVVPHIRTVSGSITSLVLSIVRFITSFFIPVCVCVLISPQCGNLWIHLWEPCEDTAEFNFAVITGVDGETGSILEKFDVNFDVCENSESRFDVCYRSALRLLNGLTVKKLIYSCTLTPIMVMTKPIIRNSIFFRYLPSSVRKYVIGSGESIKIDSQWASLLTFVDYVIILGFVCPIVIPLSFLCIHNHKVIYHYVQQKYNLTFKHANYSLSYYMLYFSIIVNQMTFLLFVYFNNLDGFIIGLTFNILLWILYIIYCYKKYSGRNLTRFR